MYMYFKQNYSIAILWSYGRIMYSHALHPSPCSNLDERTRQVYRENVKMAEALTLHMESEESLRLAKERLEMANRQLVAEKELHQQLVAEKISQTRLHKRLIRELQVSVGSGEGGQ